MQWRWLLVVSGLTLGLMMAGPVPAQENAKTEARGKVPLPCPLDADLWILAGQSNMLGLGALKEPGPTDERIVMFNMDNHWMVAQDPVHRVFEAVAPVHRTLNLQLGYKPEQLSQYAAAAKTHPVGGVGPAMPFARRILQCTGRSVGLIPCAQGGSSMAQWDPALKAKGESSLYGALLHRVALVGGKGKIKGVLWYQGESDADGHTHAVYERNLLNLVDCLRRDLSAPELPFIYVQVGRRVRGGHVNDEGFEMLRELQRHAWKQRKNMFMVSGIDQPLDDAVHVSGEGQQVLGRRLAEVALTEVYHQPGHGRAIDLESIKVEGAETPAPSIKLKFSGVSGKLISQGRPVDFVLREDKPSSVTSPVIFKVEFIKDEPSSLLLRCLNGPIKSGVQLIYGVGESPYVNITDEAGMLVPPFGPIDLVK